jgi:hypothetical protein
MQINESVSALLCALCSWVGMSDTPVEHGLQCSDGTRTPTQCDSPALREAPQAYLSRHGIHIIVDRLVRDILVEKPRDPGPWMQRWLFEHHRQQCAQRHSMSPLAKLRPESGGGGGGGTSPHSAMAMSPLTFEEPAVDEPSAAP